VQELQSPRRARHRYPGREHGSGMPVIDWARLLRCTECGERDADFVVSGARR
jgi:hypothetical protein